MTALVRQFPVRVLLTAASAQVRCKVYGKPTFCRHFSYFQPLQLERSNRAHQLLPAKLPHLSGSSRYLPFKQSTCAKFSEKLKFYRALCSDAANPDEDSLNVHYDSLVRRINSGDIQLIDIREPSELETFGQITNSIHIPLGEVADALHLPKDKFEVRYKHPKPQTTDNNIVFHCRSGVRSLKAVETAKELGYSKARHFPGGWLQWAEKNNLPAA